MDLYTDPATMQSCADRMSALAGDLAGVAARLDRLAVDGSHCRPGGVANRCAALVAGLRSDAEELAECAGLLRQDRSGLLAGETSVLEQMADLDRRLRELSGWAR
jgi:hypothetical protein